MISGKRVRSKELYSSKAGKIRGCLKQEASWQGGFELGVGDKLDYLVVRILLSGKHILLYESLSLSWSQ